MKPWAEPCVKRQTREVSVCVCVCVCVCESRSVVSDSLRPHGLKPARFLCPWNSLGKDTGVGCHSLLHGIFPTQVSHIAVRFFTIWATREAQIGETSHQYTSITGLKTNRRFFLEFPLFCSHIYWHSYTYIQIAMHIQHMLQNLKISQYRTPHNVKHTN